MSYLTDPKLLKVLDALHREASADPERWAERRRVQAQEPASEGPDPVVRLGTLYMAFSKEEGEFLYLLARSMNARRIVEFGSSFGVSTLYLAAAARDVGGAVITTEIHPDKCRALVENVELAGLAPEVELLVGDARETLQGVDGPIDLLVLDGWKGMYLPVLEILLPKLRPGALIVADNVSHPSAEDYMQRVRDPSGEFQTRVIGELALSCLVAPVRDLE